MKNLEQFLEDFNNGKITCAYAFETGSVVMGLDSEDSDIDIVIDPDFFNKNYNGSDCDNRECLATTGYPDFVYKKTIDGIKYDFIVPKDSDMFYAWKIATDISIYLCKVPEWKELLRNKEKRVSIFSSILNFVDL